MAKFKGKVGYVDLVETAPGIWDEVPTEREYRMELIRNTSKFPTSGNVNNNVDVSCEISIVADPYANYNFHAIRYIEFKGAKWDVTSVEVKRPKLILSVGGVYNGKQATTAE